MSIPDLTKWMSESENGAQFSEMLPVLMAELSTGVDFDSDKWELFAWVRRRGNRKSGNVTFKHYQNVELKFLVKLFIKFSNQVGTGLKYNFFLRPKNVLNSGCSA